MKQKRRRKVGRRTITGANFKETMALYFLIESENEPTHASGIAQGLGDLGLSVLLPDGSAPLSISRRWSRAVCEKLVKDGILTYEERKVPRQKQPVKFYKIIESLDALRDLVPRVMPLFGSKVITKEFVQEILEKELIGDLESHYSVRLHDEARESILTLVFSSTRALELALRRPELPPYEDLTEEERDEQIANDLVGVLLAGLVSDLSERDLWWREQLVDSIDLYIQATFRIGKAKATIESSLAYASKKKPRILDKLRGRGS
ncbi:MAG: hypothetical protein KAW39_00935 [Thermoplasmata archaeon]|nr:hypothetical protein [Thermoplasmata archaeon]